MAGIGRERPGRHVGLSEGKTKEREGTGERKQESGRGGGGGQRKER